MKNRPALFAVLLSAATSLVAAPSFAAIVGDTPVDNYFQSNSAISVAAMVLAAGGMFIANQVQRKRNEHMSQVKCCARAPNDNRWQRSVYQNLEAELQAFTSQFREAA